jgi:ABC-type nitrate/sulfonate/bicarbonate transport system substrate-binding protein
MGISVSLKIDGARATLRAFSKLGKDANKALREANKEISRDLAGKIAAAARASDAQSAAVAKSVKAKSDRVPSVEAGGRRLATKQRRRSSGQRKTQAGDLLFGSNFGATFLPQFRRHNGGAGSDDYWFYSTVEENEPRIVKEWEDARDRLLSEWGSGG